LGLRNAWKTVSDELEPEFWPPKDESRSS